MLQNDQIRILHLLPPRSNNDAAPIECELHVAALAEKPEYEALSYRWGARNDTATIRVSNRQVIVTSTLYSALQRLRLPDRARQLWIDQLCIDQENNDERIRQVKLMDRVYKTCTLCVIWFGEIDSSLDFEDAKAAFELIEWIADPGNIPEPPAVASDDAFARAMQATKCISVWDHPWWQRVWTLQEAVLPAHKVIVWGPLTLPWDKLSRAADTRLQGYPLILYEREETWAREQIFDFYPIDELLLHITWTDRTLDRPSSEVLLSVIMIWRGKRHASDPRDKVFGFIGLCSRTELPNIDQCDYHTLPASVYGAATLDLIGNKGLFPLMLNPRADETKGTPNIPRWAIDLEEAPTYAVDNYYTYWGWDHYNACAGRPLDIELIKKLATESAGKFNILGLKGAIIDTVAMIAPTNILFKWPTAPKRIPEILRSWLVLARTHVDLPEAQINELFGLLALGGFIRDAELWVVRKANEDDARKLIEYTSTGTADDGLWCDDRLIWMPVCNRTFFITSGGRLGIGHLDTKVGDEIWVVDGGNMPLTLRNRRPPSDYDFVGCSYVQGIMHGERFHDVETAEIRVH